MNYFLIKKAHIWISSIGFSLFFGPILAKALRVYYIFRSVKLKKKVSNFLPPLFLLH